MRIVTLAFKNFRSHQETVLDFDQFNIVGGACGWAPTQLTICSMD